MKTTLTLTLTFEQIKADPECGIPFDTMQLTDVTSGGREIHISPKLAELLDIELNPEKL